MGDAVGVEMRFALYLASHGDHMRTLIESMHDGRKGIGSRFPRGDLFSHNSVLFGHRVFANVGVHGKRNLLEWGL